MINLKDNFNNTFPGFAASEFTNSCIIEEPQNFGKQDKLRRLELKGFGVGVAFPHALGGAMSSFAKKSCHKDSLDLDCDSIILTEREGKKYMLFVELKSGFNTDEIAKAKNQIVGTYVKMKGLLSTLQGFDPEDYILKGLIAGFVPTDEALRAVAKRDDRKSAFAVKIYRQFKYPMPADRCNKFFYPLAVGGIDLYYIPIPGNPTYYSYDISPIFR